MVVSLIALFVALGGSSYAAIKITGKNVKDGSLTGKDIKKNSLGTNQIAGLKANDFSPGQLPAGAAGVAGPAGPIGPAGAKGADGAAGAKGDKGDTGTGGAKGATGPVGPAGADGNNGTDGADGATGPAGPAGADGAAGTQGPQGSAGPSGVVGFASASGPGPNAGGVGTTVEFIGVAVQATIAAGNKVHLTATKALGSGAAGGGNALNLWACSRSTAPGAPIAQAGGGSLGMTVPQGQRHQYSINHVFSGMAAGTYLFGLCGSSSNPANWNSNEFGYASILVFN